MFSKLQLGIFETKGIAMTTRILLLAAIGASMLTGCGATMARVQSNDQVMTTPQAAGAHGRHRGAGVLADLNLTADQKAQLKAIMQKARTSAGAPDRTLRQRFHALWTAPTVDGAALKALLEERAATGAKARDARVAALVEARNVLTAEQREKIAAAIEARGAKATQRPQHSPRPSSLSADTQAKLKALVEKRRAGGSQLAAFAAFARTGDAEALKAAMTPVDLSDDLVALATSLSQEERTKLERRLGMLTGFGGGLMRGRGHGPKGGQHHQRPAASV
jgi:Spy/CpxP family protein refolding chaperone